MADLSPAARAVLDAYKAGGLDAALRAAADQVVPHTAARTDRAANRRKVRSELLALAAELEAQSPELAPDSAYEKAAQLFSKIMYSPAHPELRPTHDEGIHG